MENNIMVFSNTEFGDIRTLNIDGEPWFVGKDVAAILGYANPNEAIADHVDDEDKLNSKTLLSFDLELGQRGGWLTNESGLYSLILSSKLPSAKKFKRWVTAEVLPAIRKTGGYVLRDTEMHNYIKALEQAVTQLQNINSSLMTELKTSAAILQSQVSALSPTPNLKKINIWKSKFVKPNIKSIVKKYQIDEKSAYNLVYDEMNKRFAFDRCLAICEYCDMYRTENCYTIDAIADYEPYRRYFAVSIDNLLNVDNSDRQTKNDTVENKNVVVKIECKDKFDEMVAVLVARNSDKSARGAATLGKIYREMRSDRSWKLLMSRRHCRNKKQLVMNDTDLWNDFVAAVNKMLDDNTM